MGEKKFSVMQTNFAQGYEYSNFDRGKSITYKMEFINLFCKYVFKFTKMFGLNRYKAYKFALIMD